MRLRILKSVPLLAILSDDELSKVAKAMRVQMFNPGTAIIKEGESGSRFYIINDGTVKVTKAMDDGTDKELALLKENQFFGERALIKNEKRGASVTAVTAVELLVLEQKWFQQLLLPSAAGNIEEIMKTREIKKASEAQKLAAPPLPPDAAAAAAAAASPDAAAAASTTAALAAPPKPVKEKPAFEDMTLHGIIGTGTFGRVKLVRKTLHHTTSQARATCHGGFIQRCCASCLNRLCFFHFPANVFAVHQTSLRTMRRRTVRSSSSRTSAYWRSSACQRRRWCRRTRRRTS